MSEATKFCQFCGATIAMEAFICTACGRQVEQLGAQAQPQIVVENTNTNVNGGIGGAGGAAQSLDNEKLMAVLSYLGFLWLVPFLTKAHESSAFVKFHLNEGLKVLVCWLGYGVARFLLGLVKITTTEEVWGIPVEVKTRPWFITLVITLLSIAVSALAIVGVINALTGKEKKLPLLDKLPVWIQ